MVYAIQIRFKATNNEAEYEALLTGLRVATELGVESLDAYNDSQFHRKLSPKRLPRQGSPNDGLSE